MLILTLIFLSILNIISSQSQNYLSVANIRHGKSRIRFLRNIRHMELHVNSTLQPSNFIMGTSEDSIGYLKVDHDFGKARSGYPTSNNNFTEFDSDQTRKVTEHQDIGDIKFEKLTNVRNYSGMINNKTRKVTVNGANLLGNNSWNKVDKSMLFIGERALNHLDQKKNNKTDQGVTKPSSEVDLEFTDEELAHDRITTAETMETVKTGHVDIVTRFLRIVESQHLLGENCTAGTDLNLGDGVVDRYAQERFRVEADVAVNRANMLTRLWKYAGKEVLHSEYLLHASVFSMVEFDDDIFAAGNCYDQHQYKDYQLFCPYAYRMPEGTILVKDLAVEYKYLSNTSEWFYIARKNAEKVIKNFSQFSRGVRKYERIIILEINSFDERYIFTMFRQNLIWTAKNN